MYVLNVTTPVVEQSEAASDSDLETARAVFKSATCFIENCALKFDTNESLQQHITNEHNDVDFECVMLFDTSEFTTRYEIYVRKEG